MPNHHLAGLLLASCLCHASFATAATPVAIVPAAEALAPPAAAPGADAAALLPANAVIELEMIDAVSSETSKTGDFFRMRVPVAIVAGERVLVPSGTVAVGQIVHAARSRGGGKGGELILAARYLEMPQGQVKLRSTLGAGAGVSRVKTALAVSMVFSPFALMVKGGRVEMPAGTPLSARIAADTPVSLPVESAGPTTEPESQPARMSTQ